ncbi:PQQ-binding-like beta-propeller repeat protein [Streptomyces sp. NPDC048255]|uniref:outer membrane protein assembly factor BamB family protein n=1 Tax=Streptomyces sp. NPDC048255 TaxID=3154713 RepID=UPI0033FC6E46
MARVPRGVVDADGRQAVVHDQEGALVALDLTNGAVLWHHAPSLRPCALLAGTVVAVRITPSPALAVVLLDAVTGQDRWESEPISLESWVRCTLDDTPDFTLRTETDEAADAVLIHWHARGSYRGGAAPSPQVLAAAAREARGVLRVDVAAPSVDALPEAEAAGSLSAPEAEALDAGAQAPVPPAAADVLDRSQVGDQWLELAFEPDSGAVVLRAVDPPTAAVRWAVEVDHTTTRRAPKLRP